MDAMSSSNPVSFHTWHRPRRSIEEICTIAGTTVPNIPPIPPDSVPNLESIRKVYDIVFAPGLDKFLESSERWYAREGFNYLANDRTLLGLVLAYLTLVANNSEAPLNSNDTLQSQEARVVWALLGLCNRPDHDQNNDSTASANEEADKLTRRFRIVESILTGEPLSSRNSTMMASMSDFVHQEDDQTPQPVNNPTTSASTTMLSLTQPQPTQPQPVREPTTFEKQITKRADEFWKTVENIAIAQGTYNSGIGSSSTTSTNPSTTTTHHPQSATPIEGMIHQCTRVLDSKENRDVIYSMILLGWGKNGDPSSEKGLARRFLQTEADGRAMNLVSSTLAGMALRAFE